MNIRKNQSGNWQIRMMYKGKRYTTTVKGKKPTEEVAHNLIMEVINKGKNPNSLSFRSACEKYISSRENVVSPTTLREYTRMIDRLPKWYVDTDIYEIDQQDMQRLVNELSVDHKAKTVRNFHGFCVAVLRYFIPNTVFNTRFKQNDAKTPYIPSKDEVDTLISLSEETIYHIPLQLARYSLRRSEICALLKSDLTEDNQIHVCKALVQDKDKKWVVKPPKTEDSDRYVPIDDDLADEIRALDRDRIYPFAPQNISNYLRRQQDKLGMPHFSIHKLRHYFASSLHGKVPEVDIQEVGGWKSPNVLRQIYTHSDVSRNKEKRKNIIDNL